MGFKIICLEHFCTEHHKCHFITKICTYVEHLDMFGATFFQNFLNLLLFFLSFLLGREHMSSGAKTVFDTQNLHTSSHNVTSEFCSLDLLIPILGCVFYYNKSAFSTLRSIGHFSIHGASRANDGKKKTYLILFQC